MTNGLCLEEYLGVVDADTDYVWPGEYEEETEYAEESGEGSTDSEHAAENEEDIE